jgi:hypothetical protein
LFVSSFVLYEIYLFNKADKDLNQPARLHHLRIYLRAEIGTVNKVLDHRLFSLGSRCGSADNIS